jgi:hypothetical protein
VAEAAGLEQIRPIELINGGMVGAIDMAIGWQRLNLWHQDGRVVEANFDGGRRAGDRSKPV